MNHARRWEAKAVCACARLLVHTKNGPRTARRRRSRPASACSGRDPTPDTARQARRRQAGSRARRKIPERGEDARCTLVLAVARENRNRPIGIAHRRTPPDGVRKPKPSSHSFQTVSRSRQPHSPRPRRSQDGTSRAGGGPEHRARSCSLL